MDLDDQPSTSTTTTAAADAPTTTTSGTQSHHRRRPMSREELYRLVEDLVTHNYGPQLYGAVVAAVDGAARTCLARMVGAAPGCVGMGSVGSGSGSGGGKKGGLVLFVPTGSATSTSASSSNPTPNFAAEGGSTTTSDAILSQIHAVCGSYYEYLRCVRSVFLHLDRRFVYLPGGSGGGGMGGNGDWKSGRAIPRGTSSIGTSSGPAGGGGGGGGTAAPASLSSASTASRTWGLWEVGMACLRGHMTASLDSLSAASSASSSPPPSAPSSLPATAAAAAAEARMAGMVPSSAAVIARSSLGRYDTVLTTLTVHSISTLLRSLDSIAIDSALTRSVIRTVADLGPVPSKGFLIQLVTQLTAYFDSECRRWMDMSGVGGSGDVVGYLRHVDGRLKQVGHLASFYLGSIGSGSSALTASDGVALAALAAASSSSGGVAGEEDESPSMGLLLSIVDLHLIRPHYNGQHILHPTVLHKLLDDESRIVPDIRRLYTLGKRVSGGIDQLRTAFGQYGRERGLEVVRVGGGGGGGSSASPSGASKAESKDAKLKIIPNLLSCKSHLEDLQIRAFGGDEGFAKAVSNVLEEVCNAGSDGNDDDEGDGGRRVAELLAKYVDLRFKNAKAGGTTAPSASASAAAVLARTDSTGSAGSAAVMIGLAGTTESEMEIFQAAVLSLFRHIHSKDVFEAFYKRDLAKRLLLNKSVSLDAERALVSKLKADCGGGYTAKMEGMFKDVELSRDVMANYAAHLHGLAETERAKVGNVEMDVQILTTGYWPVYPQYTNLTLPPGIVEHKKRFETYYGAKYQGRRIAWQHALGNCIVRANFPKISAPRDLVVSLCQAVVLRCFNLEEDDDAQTERGLTIKDVMAKSGLDDRGEAERVLQSLSLGRDGTRVLLKYDRDSADEEVSSKKPRKPRRAVGEHDIFKFNVAFTSNQRRIRIPNMQMKETAEERTKTHESVSRDRLYLIDATVVRIMKARKTLDHRALMGETMTQLKFPASSSDIKKRIESLIEREYMERAEGDRSRYNYLA
mmetsp:Transcript_24933/g.72123  ORF Transcript_24933/g.72123 Transcript_24933/m.72123 type:complete len:1025 (-) Transcript_24933:63-3137(-)